MVTAQISRKLFALVLLFALASIARADVIMDWNARADAIATEKRLLPPIHGRVLAIMHVAMFEAVNAIERRYLPYRLKLVADRKTSGEVAAAVAGHDVLLASLSGPEIRARRAARGDAEPGAGRAREGTRHHPRPESGGRYPRASQRRMAATWRRVYRPVTQPGVYVPTALPVASTVSGFTPWVMSSAGQFRPAPPPALTSEAWTRDFNEIREIGGQQQDALAEQTTSESSGS